MAPKKQKDSNEANGGSGDPLAAAVAEFKDKVSAATSRFGAHAIGTSTVELAVQNVILMAGLKALTDALVASGAVKAEDITAGQLKAVAEASAAFDAGIAAATALHGG